jgi:hypothetical protein
MSEKRVNVRLAAVGGDKLKADLVSIGKEGRQALRLIEDAGGPASAGLTMTGVAANNLMDRLETLASRAARAAANMNEMATTGTSVMSRINAATGVSSGVRRDAADIAAYGQAMDNLRAKYNPMFAAIQRYRQEVAELRQAHRVGAVSADEYSAALSRIRRSSLNEIGLIKGRVQGYQAMAKGAGMARFQLVQLGYQLNDIGVSLASGQNPLIVMVQQGAQIAQIYGGQGGVREMFRQIGTLIMRMPGPLKVVAGVASAASLAFAGMTYEINKTTDITVGFGDTAKAVFQVLGRNIKGFLKPVIDAIAPWFSAAWDLVKAGVKATGNFIIHSFQIVSAGIEIAIDAIPAMFKRAFLMVLWHVKDAVAEIAYSIYNMLQSVADGLNSVFNTNLTAPTALLKFGNDSRESGLRDFAAGRALTERADAAGRFARRKAEIQATDPMGEFYEDVRGQAIQNAIDRQKDDKKKGGSSKKEEKDKADELIKSLEQELSVLRETDPIKKKMLEYAKDLADATGEQRQKVLDLVNALDQEKHGFAAIGRTLKEYAEEAKRIGDDIGQALVGAFQGAEEAIGNFVKTGKLDFRDLVTSMIADLAKLAARAYILGPLAGILGNAFPSLAAGLKLPVQHIGGGAGFGPTREVSPLALVGAPRLHSGTPLGLRADEYGAILQRGERVLNRRQTKEWEDRHMGGGPAPIINFNVRDAQSIRQSRTQLAADASRLLSIAGRGR